MFVVPLLILLGVFAIYPIFCSIVYTLFDYRTNNQATAGLYVSTNFNAPLFVEDCDYIIYYLEDEAFAADAAGQETIKAINSDTDAMMKRFSGISEITGLDGAKADEVKAFASDIQSRIDSFYASQPADAQFYHKDNIKLIIDEMRTCIIESNFVGLDAYAQLLKDTRFFGSLGNTVWFTFISVFFELILGMALALIMNKAIKGIGGVRTAALIPWAIPTAVSALIWSYMYDGSSGIVAALFAKLGFIESPEMMLLSSGGAMTAAILADVWKTTPYMALLLLAGLQVIDHGLYESATIDGCNAPQTFYYVTLPLLKPSMMVALVFRTLDAFRVYDLIAVLTGGGPGGTTETLSIYAYKLMIGQSNYGYGSVVVTAMAICVGLIALVFVKGLGAELISDD